MDFNALWQDIQDRAKRYYAIAIEYFQGLDRMEMYAWGVFGLGFLLFLVGFIIWL